jgi:hypothetical protein
MNENNLITCIALDLVMPVQEFITYSKLAVEPGAVWVNHDATAPGQVVSVLPMGTTQDYRIY